MGAAGPVAFVQVRQLSLEGVGPATASLAVGPASLAVGQVRFENPADALEASANDGSWIAGHQVSVQLDPSSHDLSKLIVQGLPATFRWQELKASTCQALPAVTVAVTVAVSPSSLRFSFFDGAVEVVTRNTFLDVEVVPADTQELCRTKSCPALLHYKEETHCLEFEDTKQWARLTTESTQCPEDETDPLLGLDREERQSEGGEGETDWQWSAQHVEPSESGSAVDGRQVSLHCDDQEHPLPLQFRRGDLLGEVESPRWPALHVLAAVDRLGFAGTYDFFYLPMNRRHRQGIGYAFINFRDKGLAWCFKEAIGGYQFPGRKSKKVVHVAVAQLQGRQEVDAYFSRTQVVHTRYRPIMA
ncbi:unnamed protein product [Durusdinium trenchii]|uniref:Mei2-like C-terminal RNA recognition motif domain-containing protein n=1 Tax=Durusdinium trenchii TaxID=1381693 RepID=A0ABP0JYQ8_9DINO